MTAEGLSVGLIVTHRTWGLGKVVHLDAQNVWVYFKDIEGTPKDAVKQLRQGVAALTIAANQSDTALDNVPPMVRNGRVEPPHRPRITERQAMDKFVADFPGAFDDPRYLKQERDYKWEAHSRVVAELLSAQGRRNVAEGPPGPLAETLKKLMGLTNLLAPPELIAVNDAFRRDPRAARAFAEAVLELADEGGEGGVRRARRGRGQLARGPRPGAGADLAHRDDSAVPGEAGPSHVPQAEADPEDR